MPLLKKIEKRIIRPVAHAPRKVEKAVVRPVLRPVGRVVQAVGGIGSTAPPQPSSPQEVYI